MKKTCLLLVSCLFFSSLILTSCDNSQTSVVEGSLTIKGKNHLGLNNDYVYLEAYLDDTLTNNVKWSSSNPKVATVSSIGMVKGLSIGNVTITASLKDNEEITAKFEMEVHESFELSAVLARFKNQSYKTSVNDSVTVNNRKLNFEFEEKYYSNSYTFLSNSSNFKSSFGYGESDLDNIVYYYDFINSEVENAEFLRDEIYGYKSITYDIENLSLGLFSSFTINDDNTYIINEDSIKNIFISMLVQNIDSSKTNNVEDCTNLISHFNSLTIKVLSPTSFESVFDFFDEHQIVKMNFSVINDSNEKLANYLKTKEIRTPNVEADLLKIKRLVENHNYTRNLGTYVNGNISIEIGKCYYTKDYVYYDFTDEYINYSNEHKELRPNQSEEDLCDYGFVNIDNSNTYRTGVYYFEYKEVDGSYKVCIGERYIEENNPTNYTKYYEFFENASWIMEYIEKKLFTFQPTSTSDFANTTFKEYISNSLTVADITYYLFQDYVVAFDATPLGLIFAFNDNIDDSNCEFFVAGYLYIQGQQVYVYQDYSYSEFNTSSVDCMESFLKSYK